MKGTDLLDSAVLKNQKSDIDENDIAKEQQIENDQSIAKVKRTAAEARRAVEDFLETREHHLLYDEVYN